MDLLLLSEGRYENSSRTCGLLLPWRAASSEDRLGKANSPSTSSGDTSSGKEPVPIFKVIGSRSPRGKEIQVLATDVQFSEKLQETGVTMLYYAAVFLVLGLIGHVLHLDGLGSVAVHMSWILVLLGAVLAMVHVVTDF